MKRNTKANTPNQSMDMDPYSTSLLDQLLETHEWRNIDDIVKLTLRAISDLINLHGTSLKDIKNLLITRASKSQLTTGLSLKASVSDLSRAMTELSSVLDSKVSFSDLQSALKDYVNRADMQQVLAHRPQDSRISAHKSVREIQTLQYSLLQARMDDFQRQVTKKIALCVSLNQFQNLLNIIQQKANVSEVNQALQTKVSKQYLSTSLQKKINKTDVEQMILKKAEATDLQYIVNTLESKVSLSTLQKLTQVIDNKADKSDLIAYINESRRPQYQEQMQKQFQISNSLQISLKEMKAEIQSIRRQLEGCRTVEKRQVRQQNKQIEEMTKFISEFRIENEEQIKRVKNSLKSIQQEISNKMKNENFMKELTNQINLRKRCEEKIYEQIDDVRRRAQEVAGTCLQKREFIDFKSEIIGMVEEKVEGEQVQTALNKFEAEINERFSIDKQQTLNLLRNVQKGLGEQIQLNTKEISAINNILGKRQQKLESNLLDEVVKRTRREVEDCRKTVDTIYTQIQTKIGITQYESDLLEFRKRFDNIHREISLKANIKDVCVLADSKPSKSLCMLDIDDVNKALNELNSALALKISESDLRAFIKDQSAINETLCSENIVGRWLWQSSELKPGGLIPWQIECANTVPDYFFWQKDKTSILVLVAGIYQLTTCLFNQFGQPGILVNGELIGGKSVDNIVKKGNTKRKKDKDISGIKVQEYVMLPSRSRVSVTSNIDGSEAFLYIRRL